MNSKGQKGRCIYNCKWELDSQYKGWVSAFKADKRKALCKSCDRLIDISSMGESALKSHMKGEKHRLNSRCEQQEREKAKTVQEKTKRKSSVEEIEEIRRKRKRMDSDIQSLNEAADGLCTKAEATGKLTFVTQANALRRSAKDKVRELADMDESLKSKLEKLKEL